MVGVASRPIRPLDVCATAALDSGPTTPTASTPAPLAARCSSSAPIAEDVAELHATTTSFAPAASSTSAFSRAKERSCSGVLSP